MMGTSYWTKAKDAIGFFFFYLGRAKIPSLASARLSARAYGLSQEHTFPLHYGGLFFFFYIYSDSQRKLRRAHHRGIAASIDLHYHLPHHDAPKWFTCGRRRLAPSPSVLPAPCRRALPCRHPQSVHHLLRLLPRTSWAGWGRAPRR